jgi:hypothetical protein
MKNNSVEEIIIASTIMAMKEEMALLPMKIT